MTVVTGQYFLNHRLEIDEIEWQTRALFDAGYEGIYPHARAGLLTPYLSDDWWAAIDKIVEVCKDRDGEMWIWDEDYYPGGLAGGRVVWENPGLISRGLNFTVKEVEGDGPFEVDFEDEGMLIGAFAVSEDGEVIDITSSAGTRRQKWARRWINHLAYSELIGPVGNPHWRAAIVDNRFAVSWTPKSAGKYKIVGVLVCNHQGLHPDMLNPESISKFIEFSYEQYYQRYPREFGKVIKGAFTDEPSPGGFVYPWTPKFPEEFLADHGYDIREYLPYLILDIGGKSSIVRHHFRLTQHRLQKANYVDQIGDWCRGHDILCCGHLTRTEMLTTVSYYWPNELRCYQGMDIPSADPLGSACATKESRAYHTALKVASSAAHLFGRKHAGSDALAVIGDDAKIRDLKFMLDYQMVMGITHFIIHGLSYSLDGMRKDEVPPSIFYQHTEWKYMGELMEHARNVGEALSEGEHICELAVLYPSTSFACELDVPRELSGERNTLDDEKSFHDLSESLLCKQKDFDLIDEVTLQENVTADGEMTTPETYCVLILPYLKFIDQRSADAILRFSKAGGRVIVLGSKPRAIPTKIDAELADWIDSSIEYYDNLDANLVDSLPGASVIGSGADDIFVLRRRVESDVIVFAVNRSESAFDGEIEGRAVRIESRGSKMYRESQAECKADDFDSCIDISRDWDVEFEANHVPINVWHVSRDPDETRVEKFFTPGPFNLMDRESDIAREGDDFVRYAGRFMVTNPISDARIVMDESGIEGDWVVKVNGHLVDKWARKTVYDCRNLEADISAFLLSGSTPTLNVITIETQGEGRGLKELLYVYGSFKCDYRYDHFSFPFLTGDYDSSKIDMLQSWPAIGYPTFSGSAVYRKRLVIDVDGEYSLDLGRVEDVAQVTLDGQRVRTLGWAPYSCLLGRLPEGNYELAVEVTNTPANRNRGVKNTAGLLGPVKLLKK